MVKTKIVSSLHGYGPHVLYLFIKAHSIKEMLKQINGETYIYYWVK